MKLKSSPVSLRSCLFGYLPLVCQSVFSQLDAWEIPKKQNSSAFASDASAADATATATPTPAAAAAAGAAAAAAAAAARAAAGGQQQQVSPSRQQHEV
ncbi:hypothetical protein Efla_001003 [Eimeria flavescens]